MVLAPLHRAFAVAILLRCGSSLLSSMAYVPCQGCPPCALVPCLARLPRVLTRAPPDLCPACHQEKASRLHNLLATPELPAFHTRRHVGRISASLWAAIENGAAESYKRHVQALDLGVEDRIRLITLHVAENAAAPAPGRRREALKVKFDGGDSRAAEQILKAFSGADDVAAKIQWTIQVDAVESSAGKASGAASRVSAGKDVGAMTVVRLREELKVRKLNAKGKKAQLVARLRAHRPRLNSSKSTRSLTLPTDKDRPRRAREAVQAQGGGAAGARDEAVEEVCSGSDDGSSEDEAASDDVARMLNVAVAGLPELEKAGSTLFQLTPAHSLQPDPLSVMKMHEVRPMFEAVGRLVGCALWTGKTLRVPLARFFCRRVLEVALRPQPPAAPFSRAAAAGAAAAARAAC
jgi:hypothetical protein